MDHNAPYVAGGYGLTAAVLATYVIWMQRKLRRAERSVEDPDPGEPRP